MAQLAITMRKGVHFMFDNGITLSIQIGPGNYCNNYNMDLGKWCNKLDTHLPESSNAEIAIWGKDKNMINLGGDTILGYVPINQVIAYITFCNAATDINDLITKLPTFQKELK